MENFNQIYNRLIYRDFLGYVLPGSLIIISLIFSFSDKGFSETLFKLGELSWAWVMVLGLSFATGHILAVIPRHLPNREKIREKGIIKAMEHPRIVRLQEYIEQGKMNSDDKIKKFEFINSWINAHNKRTEMANRAEAVRIFFEHMRFALPISLLIYGIKQSFSSNNYMAIVPFVVVGFVLFGVCTIGYRGILLRELRAVINIYIDSKIQSDNK